MNLSCPIMNIKQKRALTIRLFFVLTCLTGNASINLLNIADSPVTALIISYWNSVLVKKEPEEKSVVVEPI